MKKNKNYLILLSFLIITIIIVIGFYFFKKFKKKKKKTKKIIRGIRYPQCIMNDNYNLTDCPSDFYDICMKCIQFGENSNKKCKKEG